MRREWIEILLVIPLLCVMATSPSMRREWIEMFDGEQPVYTIDVSLHAEGVD